MRRELVWCNYKRQDAYSIPFEPFVYQVDAGRGRVYAAAVGDGGNGR